MTAAEGTEETLSQPAIIMLRRRVLHFSSSSLFRGSFISTFTTGDIKVLSFFSLIRHIWSLFSRICQFFFSPHWNMFHFMSALFFALLLYPCAPVWRDFAHLAFMLSVYLCLWPLCCRSGVHLLAFSPHFRDRVLLKDPFACAS